jgi:hypothetical protein
MSANIDFVFQSQNPGRVPVFAQDSHILDSSQNPTSKAHYQTGYRILLVLDINTYRLNENITGRQGIC